MIARAWCKRLLQLRRHGGAPSGHQTITHHVWIVAAAPPRLAVNGPPVSSRDGLQIIDGHKAELRFVFSPDWPPTTSSA